MIIKTKKVYYCEFCKKKSLRKDIIEKHELHCTLNFNRECRLCDNENRNNSQKIIQEINNSEFRDQEYLDSKEFLYEIYKTINCPNCILTILRQINAKNWNFDYNKELKSWWNCIKED